MNISRGQKVDITKNSTTKDIAIVLEWEKPNIEMEIDGAAFLLEQNGQCKDDKHFVFYGQPSSMNGSVQHIGSTNSTAEIHMSLEIIPADVQKIALTITIHEGEMNGKNFGNIDSVRLTVKDRENGRILYSFDFGQELKKETAIVVGEIYRHNGEWKLNAVGMGFNGGLPALCENFGIEVATNPKEIEVAATTISNEPKVVPSTPKETKPMNVTLKKKESISIQKSAKVVATLEWEKERKDLDLYCFYVLKNGEMGKVYYKDMGNINKAPFITLDGDSKQSGKETIVIHQPSKLNYVLFAAYSALSNGIGSFKSMKAKAVVDNQMGQRVTSSLFQKNKFSYWVAIAHINFTEENEMAVSHVETYSKMNSERSPLLERDGSFKMDVGPTEFK
ncbi:TerD family protein [Viridibacillus sp. YIM B01967]|uniref:TerD family protein n=1 Tax=Viridibacillus soli TaxID=2798301 RepID=A0ABS1HA19_9BACL|nr:TerD domain-containing protein [Viridibacillus soli]MBK3496268.1 TerD family protein [Viridibacillus soli]